MEDTTGKIVSRRVQRKRRALGLTQEELARHMGVRQSMVSHVESGKSRDLETKTLIAFAKALGVSIDWLVGLKEDDEEAAPAPPLKRGRARVSA